MFSLLLELTTFVHRSFRYTKIYIQNKSPRSLELLASSRLKIEEDDRLGSIRTEALGLKVTNIRLTEIL